MVSLQTRLARLMVPSAAPSLSTIMAMAMAMLSVCACAQTRDGQFAHALTDMYFYAYNYGGTYPSVELGDHVGG